MARLQHGVLRSAPGPQSQEDSEVSERGKAGLTCAERPALPFMNHHLNL